MTRNPIAENQKPMSLIEIHEADPDECGLSREELDDMFRKEQDRLNRVLLSHLPELHRRLKLSHSQALQHWIDTNDFKELHLKTRHFDEMVEEIRKCVSFFEVLFLDLDNWCGIYPFTNLTQAALEDIKVFVNCLLKQNVREMVREIIEEIVHSEDQGRFSSLEAKYDAAFLIFSLMGKQNVANELQALWILNLSHDSHDYLFLINDDPHINNGKAWHTCRDILPAEIIEILDSKYDNGKKRN